MKQAVTVVLVALIGIFAGCPAREVSKVDPNQTKEGYKKIPFSKNRNVDLLFVIDNSGSMDEEQALLKANFPAFMNVLQNIEGGLPNVHIGVISTDVGASPYTGCSAGDHGNLRLGDGTCSTLPTNSERFIRDIDNGDGTRTTNWTGSLNETFACMASLGVKGCGFEQPLESMRQALQNNPTNQGFIRDGAYLAVIFITDEDDCSASDPALFDKNRTDLGPFSNYRCTEHGIVCNPDEPRVPGSKTGCTSREDSAVMHPVSSYVDVLTQIKGDESLVITAGIYGPSSPVSISLDGNNNPILDPSCTTAANGDADPAVRVEEFISSFANSTPPTTICQTDLTDALVQIATLVATVVGDPCFQGNIDTDPNTPGIQYECVVSFANADGTNEQPLQECSSATPGTGELPCWYFEVNTVDCTNTDTQFELIVLDSPGSVRPPGTNVIARCVTM